MGEKENRIRGEISILDMEKVREIMSKAMRVEGDIRNELLFVSPSWRSDTKSPLYQFLYQFDVCYEWLFDDKRKQLMVE